MNTRQLGLGMATALVVGNTIGMGIFMQPAALAPYGLNALTGWAAVIIGCVCLAITFAALARKLPQADGPFGYVRDFLLKPATFVVYALLVAAAVSRSERPERFITPMVVSIWVMAAVVVVYTLLTDVTLSELAGSYARSFLSPLGMHANDLGRLYATAYAILLFVWDRTGNMPLKTVLVPNRDSPGFGPADCGSRRARFGAVSPKVS